MHWVYILECENGFYYVGETNRLKRRFWEHFSGEGGVNTRTFNPINIIAIYKVENIVKFMNYSGIINQYLMNKNSENIINYNSFLFSNIYENDFEGNKEDALKAENVITERFMIEKRENYYKIRGGKNTLFDKNGYSKCIYNKCPENSFIEKIPICHCGLPCDIRFLVDKKSCFFRCAKKNLWNDFKEEFDINESEACNYYKKYEEEEQLLESKQNKIKELIRISSKWLKNVEIDHEDETDFECISCFSTDYKNILHDNEKIRLCWNCFLTKNKELEIKYKNNYKCMITAL